VAAGQTPQRRLGVGEVTRIMTGAPLPEGSDAVIMIERSRAVDDRQVHLDEQPQPEQNILRRGQEMRAGAVVLRAGQLIRPQEVGVLAAVGCTLASMYPRPSVAILPTGNELTAVGKRPRAGEIRESNGLMLHALMEQTGASAKLLGVARDTQDSLKSLIAEGLNANVLVLTGGVSAGKLDLVPDVLAGMGVKVFVHQVAMKPGKPMLFGVHKNGTLVFGLPGNPVSTWVCFELFVGPALRRLAGHAEPGPFWTAAVLDQDFAYRASQPTYHPARIRLDGPSVHFRPVPWFGSADLAGSAAANGLVLFSAGDHLHRAGQEYSVLPMELLGRIQQ
jgi:molybdopterin molybdotransferase